MYQHFCNFDDEQQTTFETPQKKISQGIYRSGRSFGTRVLEFSRYLLESTYVVIEACEATGLSLLSRYISTYVGMIYSKKKSIFMWLHMTSPKKKMALTRSSKVLII